jgi:hypothetical protein
MAATMSVYFDFGGTDGTPGTNQDVDALGPPSIRFKTADDATIDTGNPIPVPASGTNYSYWKQVYLYCDDPDGNTIDNIKFYSDGSIDFGTGVTLYVGDETPTKNSGSDAGYEVATGTPSTTGDSMVDVTNGHSDLTGQTSAASLTSGSPLSVSISEAGNVIDLAGETSDYVVLQVAVADTASAGLTSQEILTFQYDETV